ncbi:4'-phosphopantetheinyl transferase family protein [Mesorhizobium sp. 1B3]|uniref:4'-phosphopantetheinyl transferase family protein n=1 Tax=Mesorhizobium sp. 1B3 TaxID=3243599 RepID=UPI003D9691C0
MVANAVVKRRHEFLTGRALARRALADLGCPPVAIGVGDWGVPIWPDSYIGAISHSGDLCVAHIARTRDLVGIGVDIEQIRALPPNICAQVCSREEWCRVSSRETSDILAATLCFSAKEAVYKAYFPAARVFLEFTDVYLEVNWRRNAFSASLSSDKPGVSGQRVFEGRFARIGNHIATAVWIASAAFVVAVPFHHLFY